MKIKSASIRLTGVVGLTTAALLLAACGGSSGSGNDETEGTGQAGGAFSFAIAEPEALAPSATCYETECSYVLRNILIGLAQADPKGDGLKLQQAKSITSEDSQHWTVKLKKGWKFENGEPVDADAYIRAWNYGAYGPNAARANFFFERIKGYDAMNSKHPTAKKLSGLKKVNDYEFTIDLTSPFSQWPSILSGLTFLPMAKACVANMKKCNEHPIGNGPYKMDGDWEHNQSITLKRWAGYKGPNPGHADKITLKIYPKKDAALQDLLAGQTDIIRPNPDQVDAAKGQANIKTLDDVSSSLVRFSFPAGVPAYDDPRVRRAISMAINRKAITKSILPTSMPADDIISPVVPGYKKGACSYCVYNPTKAKKLLAEAGGWKGGTMNIWLPADQGYDQELTAIGNQLHKNLGINFTLKSVPQAKYYQMKSYDGPHLGTWSMDYRSPENYLRPQFSTAGLEAKKKWHDATFEKLLDKADAESNSTKAVALYRKAADIVNDQLPSAPLFFGKAYFFYNSDKVTNVQYDGANDILPLASIEVK